jgi:hypothetical protein
LIYSKLIITAVFFLFFHGYGAHLLASEQGSWSVSAGSEYSTPVGGLSEWFKPAFSYSISIGKQHSEQWHLEGMLTYSRYDEENLSGYPEGRLDLFLEHTGILLNAKYDLKTWGIFHSYWNMGGGLYHWKGIRGRIDPDVNMEPVIPLIEKNVLQEWNWGFRSGIGIGTRLMKNFTVDVSGYYRFIVGDLWPTLQPHIELEGVSGFQSLNLELEFRYFIK